MSTKIKTAVIGVGKMGRNHARVYSEISDLTAVCDTDSDVGTEVAEKFKTKHYKGYQEMLDKETPEAVSVVVPTKYHQKIALDCLKRGIPTLVEKPIANTLEEAAAILSAAKEAGVTLVVGHIERFNPVIVKLKELINQNCFGSITNLLAVRVGNVPPKTPRSDATLDLAIHDIDIFNYLLGELPHRWYKSAGRINQQHLTDSSSILLEYPNAVGMIQANWITPIKVRRLYITGTRGFGEIDYIDQKLILSDKVADGKKNSNFFEFIYFYSSPKQEVPIFKKEPLKEELLYFIDCINKRSKPDPSYAVEALRIALTNC